MAGLVPQLYSPTARAATGRRRAGKRGSGIVAAMRAFLAGLAIVMALGATACETGGDPGRESWLLPDGVDCQIATVRSVSDGDTVRADLEDGPDDVRVRYIGIDTPELTTEAGGPEPFAADAAERNEELVRDRRVCLERDVSQTDRFGRLLRYVWLPDGTLVNEILLREGLASVATFPPDVKYVERFRAAERAAREARAGRWRE